MTPTPNRIVALTLVAQVLTGCGGTASRPKEGQRGTVLFLVAASTQDAVREIGDIFGKENGVEVRLNADASSKLATQISQDAPGDLFLSASEEWGDFVREKGYADRSVLLLANRLVLIVPRGNPARVARPEDLAQPAVKRLALAG